MFGELFSGALHKNPVIAPGQLHKIIFYRITVRIKIIADPEKCFQELISEKLLIFVAG